MGSHWGWEERVGGCVESLGPLIPQTTDHRHGPKQCSAFYYIRLRLSEEPLPVGRGVFWGGAGGSGTRPLEDCVVRFVSLWQCLGKGFMPGLGCP